MNMRVTKRICFIAIIAFTAMILSACQQKAELTFQGYVEGELVYLSSPFSGMLKTLSVERGEKVASGVTIFKLDPEPEVSQLLAAKNTLKEAEANLANVINGQRSTVLDAINAQIKQAHSDINLAAIRVKRFETLYTKNAIDKDSVDAAENNYQDKVAILQQLEANLAEAKLGSRENLIKAQQAVVKAAEASVTQATWALSQKTLSAPTGGIIFDTFYWPGEWVAAGQPVAALLAPQYIRFIFFVPETLLGKIALGQTVEISCDGCDKHYPATISYISPQVEYTPPVIYSRENNYNLVYRIRATPALADALYFHPGQPVYVTLENTKNSP